MFEAVLHRYEVDVSEVFRIPWDQIVTPICDIEVGVLLQFDL
jgi:hypothetical protein